MILVQPVSQSDIDDEDSQQSVDEDDVDVSPSKKIPRCSLCGEEGHNKTKCPKFREKKVGIG